MMTAYGSVDAAVEAMKRGAYDFVTKPLNIDRLEILIQRALRSRKVEKEVVELKQQVEKRYGLERLIGESRGDARRSSTRSSRWRRRGRRC